VKFDTKTIFTNRVVGFMHYITVEPGFSSFPCLDFDKICYIKAFAIEKNERRKGYGNKLLKNLLADVDDEVAQICVRIKSKNSAAKKIFERNGFKINDKNGEYSDYILEN
jgi:ribosomal protein S18 acetylase RimI-like enzyme